MKNIFYLLLIVIVFYNCNNQKTNDAAEKKLCFGDSISENGAISSNEVEMQLKNKDSIALKISGKITDVCQKKGCWMMMDIGNGKTMRVTFKDYAFFVPKDAAGKTAVIEGYAYTDTTSISQLKHYAEDANKSKAEIDAITSPEVNTSFEARGVILK